MFFKLVQNNQVHIFNPKDKSNYISLQKYIKDVFKKLPNKYQLYYIDDQNDQITLANQQDFKIMVETANKTVKIFIKETKQNYYEQTQNIVLDDDQSQQQQPLIVQNTKPEQQEDFKNYTETQIQQIKIDLLSKQIQIDLLSKQIQQDSSKIIIQNNSDFNYQKLFIQQQKFQRIKDLCSNNQPIIIDSNQQEQKYRMIQDYSSNNQPIIIDSNQQEQNICQPSICNSKLSVVSQAMIEQKINEQLPSLIEKVKAQVLKQFVRTNQIKQKMNENNPFIKESKPIHRYITCDNCNKNNIEGVRYKCSVCNNFDICENCQVNFQHAHAFLKIKRPEQAPLKIVCIMDDQKESMEINGHKLPFPNFQNINLNNVGPYLGNLFNFMKQDKGEKGVCPFFNKAQDKPEQKKQQKIPEKKVEQKKQQVKQPERKNIFNQFEGNNEEKIMQNAIYLTEVLDIDYTRCYKFAKNNKKLNKEQLLELYFAKPQQL